jgi:uncharacterized protein YbjT (DUF2867 family)
MSRVLVIGATGTVGRYVLRELSESGQQVRALTRNPDTGGWPRRVEVVTGDLTKPETLDGCVEDVDAMFLVWTAPAAAFRPAWQRIARRVRRVVFLSAPLKTPHPFFQQPNPMREMAMEIERLIEGSELEWTFVRPGMFAANALRWWAPQIRAGDVVRWPYLSVATAPIDERDIAAVAVRALCETGHNGAEYVLTGPQSLSQYEQIAAIGDVTGRRLHIEELPPEVARRELLDIMPQPIIDMLMNAWAAADGPHAFATSTVADITGTPPRSFVEWATDHAASFMR